MNASDSIECALLPAGEWVTFLHRGPYSHATEPDLAAAHANVRAWIEGQRAVALAREEPRHRETVPTGCIEAYRIGPIENRDFRQWETELAYLVELSQC